MRFIFPLWVWVFAILAWFSAEIVTATTAFNDINFIFSFSYYIVQVAIVADIIVRKNPSWKGIIVLGLIFGLVEESFYIKNPLPLTILLALGHSSVTIVFPYILTKFIIPGKKDPFLSKWMYIGLFAYLSALYVFMAIALPFAYIDSLIFAIIAVPALIFLFARMDKQFVSGDGIGLKEKIYFLAASVVVFALTRNAYFL